MKLGHQCKADVEKSCSFWSECRETCDYYNKRYSEVLVQNIFLDNYSAFILANPSKADFLVTPVKLDLGLNY
jgi:isocitrate/isopropylmalate dehydrogenase